MYSLQSRLGLWLGLMLVLIFGLHMLLMSNFPRYLAEEHILTRLQHDGESLYARLIIESGKAPRLSKGPLSPIYKTPLSGHYFFVQAGEHTLRSPSLEGETLDMPEVHPGGSTVLRLDGPLQKKLLMWVSETRKNGQAFTLAVAEDIEDIDEDISELRKAYFIGTSVTVLLLIFLQRFVIRRTLKPIEKTRKELLAIEAGEASKINQEVPSEIQPLVSQINRLLEVMHKRIERSRNASGNLAHALKTPLSILNQVAETPEILAHPELSKEISQISATIKTAIDRELKRARLVGGALPGQCFYADRELPELVDVMQKIFAEKSLHFDVSIPAGKKYSADREDMLELFGNLLDNACKWAKQHVKLIIMDEPGLYFVVEDDGEGVEKEALKSLTQRGNRLDEKIPGHGLGLSIVQEIVEQYGGQIEFGISEKLGGFSVRISLPETL
ncbi:MAG TPA: GHKL domain-containing protein [Chromatiales bacterium]|nr:GHKL domain-containing protein [Thiotrichales bacterium]HIP69083.1 GHKL domain-containing protein [Chromatiales bacterium]